eukprot:TRINITY_DN50_c18_g1_i1.p2 TRINITY_DN50_c18_g1~~TRINITY_DN50_c18_g1_i1.p2  ORF type:complete len:126 (+),score=3.33 TRINITY_DN50_c18_g1_i1:265-642(+)
MGLIILLLIPQTAYFISSKQCCFVNFAVSQELICNKQACCSISIKSNSGISNFLNPFDFLSFLLFIPVDVSASGLPNTRIYCKKYLYYTRIKLLVELIPSLEFLHRMHQNLKQVWICEKDRKSTV